MGWLCVARYFFHWKTNIRVKIHSFQPYSTFLILWNSEYWLDLFLNIEHKARGIEKKRFYSEWKILIFITSTECLKYERINLSLLISWMTTSSSCDPMRLSASKLNHLKRLKFSRQNCLLELNEEIQFKKCLMHKFCSKYLQLSSIFRDFQELKKNLPLSSVWKIFLVLIYHLFFLSRQHQFHVELGTDFQTFQVFRA